MARLNEGDNLVVPTIDHLANNMPRLIEVLVSLMGRGITVSTVSGDLDTADPTTARLLEMLSKFEKQSERRRHLTGMNKGHAGGGRPRRLLATEIEVARARIEAGRPISEVARNFGVSRATLYRNLKRT